MPTIVQHYDKKTGKTRVYESTPHYDPVTKQSRPKRKYLGTLDTETGELIPCYTAYAHKNMKSLDDDNVLNLLTSDTKTMHDHNTINYNNKYSFENIECNQHLQRDCQKKTDDTCHQIDCEK